MAASHSGEDRHVRTVQTILREGGLSREVLQCGMHAPYDSETAQRLLRDGEPLTPLRHNCSGKHAGMALHAKAAGWPVETYWHPDHPVQQLALQTVAARQRHADRRDRDRHRWLRGRLLRHPAAGCGAGVRPPGRSVRAWPMARCAARWSASGTR